MLKPQGNNNDDDDNVEDKDKRKGKGRGRGKKSKGNDSDEEKLSLHSQSDSAQQPQQPSSRKRSRESNRRGSDPLQEPELPAVSRRQLRTDGADGPPVIDAPSTHARPQQAYPAYTNREYGLGPPPVWHPFGLAAPEHPLQQSMTGGVHNPQSPYGIPLGFGFPTRHSARTVGATDRRSSFPQQGQQPQQQQHPLYLQHHVRQDAVSGATPGSTVDRRYSHPPQSQLQQHNPELEMLLLQRQLQQHSTQMEQPGRLPSNTTALSDLPPQPQSRSTNIMYPSVPSFDPVQRNEPARDTAARAMPVAAAAAAVAPAPASQVGDEVKHNRTNTSSEGGKPVRPLNSYNYFYREERKRLIEERRGSSVRSLSLSEMTARIAARWNDLPSVERSRFERLASEDTARYKREKAAWDQKNMEQWERIRKEREAAVDEETWRNYFDTKGKSSSSSESKRRKS